MRERNPTVGPRRRRYEPLRPGGSTGSEIRNVAPPPGGLSAAIDPPWASTSPRAIASPSPDPRESADFANRSKTWGRRSGSIPAPVSATVSSTRRASPPPSTAPLIVTVPPARRVADRVRDEVRRRPPGSGPGRRRGAAGRPATSIFERRRRPSSAAASNDADHVRHEDVEVGRLAVEGSRPGLLRASVRRSSTSRVRTRVSSRIDSRCLVGRALDAVEDRLDVALDDRERRPQLVADVGEERPPLGLARLEPAGHRVEAADEVADGSRRADRDWRPARSSRPPRPASAATSSSSRTTRSTGSGDRPPANATAARISTTSPSSRGDVAHAARPPRITLRTAAIEPDEDR